MNILELKGVSVTLNEQQILREISFSMVEGDKIVISGPSGSGKSTLLRAVLGNVPVTSGIILFKGKPVTHETIQQVRQAIAFIGQEPALGGTTAREGLLLPFSFKAHRERRPTIDQIGGTLDRLGLETKVLEQPVSTLSGGEKQRLALARALLIGRTVFLADETTSSLDPESLKKVISVLSDPSATVLTVSHQVDWPPSFKPWTLERGRLQEGRN